MDQEESKQKDKVSSDPRFHAEVDKIKYFVFPYGKTKYRLNKLKYFVFPYGKTKYRLNKLKVFCESLTKRERECLFKDDKDFDIEAYRNQFYGFGVDNAVKHAQDFLESLKEDLEGFHLIQELLMKNLSIPKLLTRFIKLPELFRTYLKMTVIAESIMKTDKNAKFDFENESESISDELFVQHLTAIELSSKEKFKYFVFKYENKISV